MNGYHSISCLFGQVPELASVRSFRTAHAFNTLTLQAEVTHIYHSLCEAAKEQRKLDIEEGRKPLDESIQRLKLFRTPEGKPCLQWKLTTQLRSKLKEYHEAIDQFKTACQSSAVRPVNLKTFLSWLHHEQGGKSFLGKGFESEAWARESDLTSIFDIGHNDDAISRWFNDKFLGWFYNTIGHRFKPNELPLWEPALSDVPVMTPLDMYSESTITRVVTGISTVLSSLMPCLAMFLLYYVRPPAARLSIILVLSLMFSIALVLLTTAKRSECFTATATFAAVLVVFVGSTDTSSGKASLN